MTYTTQPMAITTFADLPNTDVPVGIDRVTASNGAGYIYDAAVDAAYVNANPRTAAVAQNGRGFRLDPFQRLQIEFFGGKADSTITNLYTLSVQGTDNADSIEAAIDFQRANIYDVEWPYSPPVHFGAGVYYTSRTIQPYGAMHLVGVSAGNFTGTVIRFPADTVGVLINNRNCLRDGGGYSPSPLTSASGSIIENIHFQGGGPFGDKSKHGFWGRTIACLKGCVFSYFPGCGIAWIGGSNDRDDRYGTPNAFYSERNIVQLCGGRAGYYVEGYDANAGTSIGDTVKGGLGAGFMDLSSLGNSYVNPSVHSSGQIEPTSDSRVHYNGYQWHCTTRTSTNQPPARGSTSWIRVDAQAQPSPYWPAWDASKTYFFEGAIYVGLGASNQTSIFGYYVESLLVSLHESGAVVTGGNAFATPGSNNIQSINGALVGSSGFGATHRWKALAQTQEDFLGEVSTAHVGAANYGTFSVLRHYNSKEDRIYSYHPDDCGDHVYANGPLGAGETRIYRVTGRFTACQFGRGTPTSLVFEPFQFGLTDPQYQNGEGTRIMRCGSTPPTGSGAEGEVVWNNGLDPAYAAVDYWRRKGGTWVARP